MTRTARDLRSAAHALRTAANALEGTVTALRALSDDLNEPDPDPEPSPTPAWPTAPHVWWEGEVWTLYDDGEYQTAGDYWAKSHLDSTAQPHRDGARRFAREAIPVTIVPTDAWERLRQCVEDEEPAWGAAEALVDATEALNGETND